jgi:hypothetical protein
MQKKPPSGGFFVGRRFHEGQGHLQESFYFSSWPEVAAGEL